MENLEFILGALSMIGMLVIGYAVTGVFKVTKSFNSLKEVMDGTQTEVENNHMEIHRRIDGEIDRVDRLFKVHNIEIGGRSDEIYRYIDSRFDKFENRLKKIDKEGCEPVKTSKQILTD